MQLLNLGCGSRFHRDWVNVDMSAKDPSILKYNLLGGLPFKDESFDVVYHSHVLEHFRKQDGRAFLEECYRVLKPGGILRIAIPDLERIAREYVAELDKALAGDKSALPNHAWMTLELLDQLVRVKAGGEMGKYLTQPQLPNETFVYRRTGEEARHYRETYLGKSREEVTTGKKNLKKYIRQLIKKMIPKSTIEVLSLGRFRLSGEIHQWMYDRVSLSSLLQQIGFANTTIMTATTSVVPHWTSYELDANAQGTPFKPDSLYVEAQK